MSEAPICQSCGVPMPDDGQKGTNADGSLTNDYCRSCYKNGSFTTDISLEDMVEINLRYLDEWSEIAGKDLSIDEAREMQRRLLPTLKRWR